MLKIGDFSRISQVTIKALRLYDSLELLQPASVDPFTDYRYYTLDQLADIHRIVALKEMGLSLDQIRDLLSSDLPLEQLRGMLRLKRAELQQRIDEETLRLRQAEFRLRQLELEENMPTLDVVIKKVEPFHAMTVRTTVPTRSQLGDVGGLIKQKMEDSDFPIRFPLPPNIPVINIFYGNEYLEENIDVEYCMPIDRGLIAPIQLDAGLICAMREVSGMDMAACYVFKGRYDAVADHYPLLQRWIAEQGYIFGGEIRYLYLRHTLHGAAPADLITEIQARISKP